MSRLHAVKGGPCRVCHGPYDVLHCLVADDLGGAMVADNLVPLCNPCDILVEAGDDTAVLRVGLSLTAAERAHVAAVRGPRYLGRRWRVWLTRTHVIGAKEAA